MFFLLFGCATIPPTPKKMTGWHYQLQDYDKNKESIVWDQAIFYVVDPDELEKRESTDLLPRMKAKGIVLSYLSIGEAEDYRDYYKTLPKELVLFENKDWEGNFKVKYWESAWQEIILSKIKNLIEEDYQGVYLDIVDAFYELKPHKLRASQMRDFLKRIHDLAKELDPNFLIVQQNAPTITDYLPEAEREPYFSLIDGIAYEDCFFHGDEDEDNKYNPQDYCLESFPKYLNHGKFILSVEYLKDSKLKEIYQKRIQTFQNLGTVLPLSTNRALSVK